MDTVENNYADLDAAITVNAVGAGKWIPGFLPPSARNIHEMHNVDTNESWLTCEIDPTKLGPMITSCSEATRGVIEGPRKSPGRWWLRDLVRPAVKNLPLKGLVFYRCIEGAEMAIDIEEKKAYYWSAP